MPIFVISAIFASENSSHFYFILQHFDMKKLHSIAALFLLVFFASCAKDESLLESSEIAPLYQHWALEFDNDVVEGMPYGEKYPDASGLTAGYEFFADGKGVDYGYTPHAQFTFEVIKNGGANTLIITKNVPTLLTATSNTHNFEGGCSNNYSNGSGCNNTLNFNNQPDQSVVYETKTESFKIVELTTSSLQGYILN